MRIIWNEESVSIEMANEEAVRLGFALRIGYETCSRAEYFIRTTLSQPVVEEIAHTLIKLQESAEIELVRGVESVENPRRPRPAD